VNDRARRLVSLARLVVTLVAVGLVVVLVDVRAVGTRLGQLDARYLVLFLLLSIPLYLLAAWRWHFSAARVGAPLGFQHAYFDYYLSTLLNQVLPVGVAGDVVRAARHRRRLRNDSSDGAVVPGSAARAVILERLSGFVALTLFVIASALVWLGRGQRTLVLRGAGGLLLLVVVGALVVRWLGRRSPESWLAALAHDGRKALFADGALPVQLGLSTAHVALLLAMFACAARATGVSLDLLTVVQVVPPVLACTTVPWAFAGWGVREASTAALYGLMGLDVASGVAVSVSFGLLSLLAAAPGLLVLGLAYRDRRRGP